MREVTFSSLERPWRADTKSSTLPELGQPAQVSNRSPPSVPKPQCVQFYLALLMPHTITQTDNLFPRIWNLRCHGWHPPHWQCQVLDLSWRKQPKRTYNKHKVDCSWLTLNSEQWHDSRIWGLRKRRDIVWSAERISYMNSILLCSNLSFRFLWPYIVSKVWRERERERKREKTIRCNN